MHVIITLIREFEFEIINYIRTINRYQQNGHRQFILEF